MWIQVPQSSRFVRSLLASDEPITHSEVIGNVRHLFEVAGSLSGIDTIAWKGKKLRCIYCFQTNKMAYSDFFW